MDKDETQYLIDPALFGLDERRAAAVALLDEDQMKFAAALVRRQADVEWVKAACNVLLDGKPELLDQMSDADYQKIAWQHEQDCTEPDTKQVSEACEKILEEKFGRAWLD